MAFVYFLKMGNKIVYVGKTINEPIKRVKQHQNENTKNFDSFSFLETTKEENAKIEKILIAHYKPIYNNPSDRYPELELRTLGFCFREEVSYNKAVKYIEKNNIEHYKFNGKYYVSRENIEKIQSITRGQTYFEPTEIEKEIKENLKDFVEVIDGKIIINLAKED